MKRIINTTVLIGYLVLIVSCSKDFLKPKPLSFFTPENVYVDKAGFEAGLVTVRNDMKKEFLGNRSPLNGDVSSTDLGSETFASNWSLITPSTGTYLKYLPYFSSVYGYIKNTNVIISRIDDIQWDNIEDRNAILAEALFYRSYWYYRLVHSYGDVPWVGEEAKGAKLDYQTFSKWAILTKIQSDLEYASANLPDRPPIFRPSKYVALHLLTKVYLDNLQFEKAIEAASTVINGPFNLMTQRFGSYINEPQYNLLWDLHRPENKALSENKEVLLAVINREDAPENARIKSYTMRNFSPHWWYGTQVKDSEGKPGTIDKVNGVNTEQYNLWGRGNGDMTTVPWFNYDLWDDGIHNWTNTPDLRRADINWVDTKDIIYNNPASVDYGKPVDINNFSQLSDTLYSVCPFPFYKVYYPEPADFVGNPMGGYGDYYVYRLAETYLIRAEAYFWKDQLDLAAQDINKIRERSGAIPISASDITLDYIFDERARELYLEEMRHTELVRASYILARLNKNGYKVENFSSHNWYFDRMMDRNQFFQVGQIGVDIFNFEPYNVLWPIDIKVSTANTQGIINQNEGYLGASNNIPPIEVIP